ncbi:hypothetical protein A3K29_04615 [Candidatus Collierbacteria bacterium RIFOXYB2_FULL_46_14]|uniref:Uncharacterized protein n=1 Tax=Candidatus Collierbacteria bacterium GW2011_GWA2_46_26 TaxID=1618381 RepID=A0A0G1PK12_9BACT|nr:MAG: hypothetical protein UW29_C0005G0027 [Candidatus Collierbacteria bacterium GW2011_GWC2_44_13]KKU33139.1 MAG: hypothetical protein UX47_C0006G0110 [Candidatus Collierbacteria bacterium GW2011_GWA2_46_26]OGD73381.1 MAG: hypothetical protein A3K29_04615 [Candidatus Collierbacteria bacterium RIFOXYB2_FULL_46_14]OGD76423.1 MAG: hypothetical protein A3K43_04615 [Candidatus Collierbacteria bacterium RIFOXYA2_FULL_46_20]OGD77759.1 MAG: hypothetical protein A3K39_04615 [Candidatus Collierbacteri
MPFNWPGRRDEDFTHHEDFSHELLGHNSSKPKPIETEPTPETKPEKQPQFSWVAFVVMIISIGLALLVGMIIPGILDEYIAMFIITTLYGFAQAHGFKAPKK